ncbi:MAG TPA: glucosaminidase domain-containing protein [Steroidobacteraceae bacterium]|jgi:flagellar protein FlgJ|nr:glucosaminidase domain-containing protein [Steroidobacteraceae bacterium]
MDSTLPATFYADFSGLTTLKKDVKANDPQAIREAARQFESLFTDMMLKSMRAAKLGDGLGDSQETDLYQDMYDQQLALQMSQGKGLGLADMLVQQLTRSGAAKAAGGATPSAAGAVSDRARISFIQRVEPYAQRAAAQLGVSSDSVIAQAALETGWGQHVPGGSGGSSNNLFGVKAGTGWSGESASAATTEYSQGVAASVPQSFRVYSSLQQGVNDYVSLLQRNSSYRQALGTGDDIGAFAGALQRGGYASDPDYARKLVATAASVKTLRAATSPALKLQAGVPITSGGEPA